ncbi:MAG: hypothetical protein H0U49_08715 [Parachlamydiaceae bacterium]|nr:hypothetical protein [Parachlamydiaceae bacterium]
MQKRIFLILALWTVTTTLYQSLEGQYSAPYSTSSVQGSTIITNYYDPNAVNTGPGLPTSPLQSRFTQPIQPSTSSYQSNSPFPFSNVAPVQIVGQPVITSSNQNPLGTLPGQQPLQPYQQINAQQPFRQQSGPILLNPVGSTYTPQYSAHYEDPIYPYPGLLTRMNGRWIGSQYLYDIPQNIGIVLEVIKPGIKQIDIDTGSLRNATSLLFSKANINPESLAIGEDPPLPFFHILILVYPDEDKVVAAISGRFIEKVKISRLDFNIPGTTQAITWEKLDLIITSALQFPDQLQETVLEIATTFIRRVQYFAEEKAKLNTGFRVQGCMQQRVPEYSRMDNCDYNCR